MEGNHARNITDNSRSDLVVQLARPELLPGVCHTIFEISPLGRQLALAVGVAGNPRASLPAGGYTILAL